MESIDRHQDEILKNHGHLDILVNNAGIETDLPFIEMPMDVFDEMMHRPLMAQPLLQWQFPATFLSEFIFGTL